MKFTKTKKRRLTITHKLIILAFGLIAIVSFIVWKAPLVTPAPKQYLVSETVGIEKIAPTAPAEPLPKQTVIKTVQKKFSGDDIAQNDSFARWAVLENVQAGYKFVYPDGFAITYDAEKVVVTPPAGGGKVVVTIANKTHTTSVDAPGVSGEQLKLLEAAKKLIDDSFEFIDRSESNSLDDSTRFTN